MEIRDRTVEVFLFYLNLRRRNAGKGERNDYYRNETF